MVSRYSTLVTHIVLWNCFDFPHSSCDYHWLLTYDPAEALKYPHSAGMWILASNLDHSCIPNTIRSCIGDMMIVRAGADLPGGTELTHAFTDSGMKYEERQKILHGYGVDCDCKLCHEQKNTSNKKIKQRAKIGQDILSRILADDLTQIETYDKLLDDIEATYTHPPFEEPRLEMLLFT